MNNVDEIIRRVGADSLEEKAAWRKIIEGVTTVVYCQLRRRVSARPSFYNTDEASLRLRIRDNLITSMLHITDAVGKIRDSLDFPGVTGG